MQSDPGSTPYGSRAVFPFPSHLPRVQDVRGVRCTLDAGHRLEIYAKQMRAGKTFIVFDEGARAAATMGIPGPLGCIEVGGPNGRET